jgi:hypothetical protein
MTVYERTITIADHSLIASFIFLFQNDSQWKDVCEGIREMPARIPMTERQRAELLALPVTEEEVVARYSLDDAELKAIARLRSPANRLGYALQGSVANMGHGRAASPSWGIRQHWRNAY